MPSIPATLVQGIIFPMGSRKKVRSTLDQLDAEVKRQYSLSILVIHIDDEWKINGKDAIRVEQGDEIQLRRLIGYLVG